VDGVHNHALFVLHSLFHWQPVKLLKRRCAYVHMVSDCRWGEQRNFGLWRMLTVDAGSPARREYQSLVWTLPAPGLAVLWPHDQHVVEFAASVSAGENRRRQLWRRAACFIDSSWSIHTPMFRTILTGCIVSVPTVRVRSHCCSLARLRLEPTLITSVLSAFSCNRWDRRAVSVRPSVWLSVSHVCVFWWNE